jgi:hypothetical protein
MMLCESVDKQSLIASGYDMINEISDNNNLRLLFELFLRGGHGSAWAAGSVLVSLVNHMAYTKANQEENYFEFSESQSALLEGFSIVGVLNEHVLPCCELLRRPHGMLLLPKLLELVRAAVRLNSITFFGHLKEGRFFELAFEVFFRQDQMNIFHS